MRSSGVITALWLASCASAPATPAPASSASETRAAQSTTADSASARDPRALPPAATFADVVDAARALDEASPSSKSGPTLSEAGCLIDRRGPPRLAADLLIGARPLARAPDTLGAALAAAAGPLVVLSAWGSTPGEASSVALVAFTTTSPDTGKLPAIGAILTREGVFLRGSAPLLRSRPEPQTIASAGLLLSQLTEPAPVFVSAEAAIPLPQLIDLLRAIPNRFEVALAVALPPGTRLPAPPTAASDPQLLCPEGLPAPSDDEPEGDLAAAELTRALGPLREAALSCATSAGGKALAGGRLVLALRIGPTGRVRELCLQADAISEPVLQRCLLQAARSLAWPEPSPAGFVDVHLPLELALAGPPPQRALCE